jgi:hypothetical protein
VLEGDAAPDVTLREARQVRLQAGPVQRCHLLLDRLWASVFRLGVDFRLGIQGIEHEARCHGVVDVLKLLQMIRVAADRLRPAGLEGAPGRVIEHVARRPMAAAHLANGLLGEDRVDRRADRVQRSHVARRGQPEPVAKAGRSVQSEAGRLQPGQRRPQRKGILRRGLRDQANLAIDPLRCTSEAAEVRLIVGHSH